VSAHSCGKLLIAAINAPMPFETLPPIGVELSYINLTRSRRVEGGLNSKSRCVVGSNYKQRFFGVCSLKKIEPRVEPLAKK
jgi:hypothetical protein